MSLTLVTALFSFPGQQNRPYHEYFDYFELIATTQVPILFFLDPVFQGTPEVARILETFPSVSIQWLPLDSSFLEAWGEPVQLPTHRNVRKDTQEYMCIQLMKLKCLVRSRDLTRAEYLAWIDCGIFHIIQNVAQAQQRLKDMTTRIFLRDAIIAPKCCPSIIPQDITESVCWFFAGGFLLGHRDLLEPAYQRQRDMVELHKPKLFWEVNYWFLMKDLFVGYEANHNDSILFIPASFDDLDRV